MSKRITITVYDGIPEHEAAGMVQYWLKQHAESPKDYPLTGSVIFGKTYNGHVIHRRDHRKGLCFAVTRSNRYE